ncbi:hypothetical protein BDE02_08G203200 [Populus trichocarpa]|nr:hypothetical protein BDE02_08G203200 [Populus trichocarpa]
MRRGTRRARKSFLSGTSGSRWAVAGAEAPAPASHSASESTSDRARASSAGVRSTGTRAPLLGSPRAPGEARGGEGQLHIRVPPKWVRSTGTPPRRKAPRGPWAESDGGSRPTVRCTSTEPADTDSPITAHATLRTRDNNPDERTTATRASGNTRARSCPHRWTRRISKGQATSRTRRISKGQATSRTRRISKGQATSRTRRISKGQATGRGGNDGDNHAGGCLPRLGRRRPGLGSRHVTPRGRGLRGEPTHGRAHDNLMPRPRQRRALLAIPELGGPPQPRRPGLQLASTGSGHRSRTRRISKGQGTGRGGKRRGQSCGGLSAPARKTEARPRQRAHHATSHVSQASDLRAGAAATAAVTSRQADGRAAAASTLARAWQMNATPTPRISSPNAPDGLERVPKTVAGIGSGRPERGGQGPKAAPPRAREQASKCCRLPRPATSGWPLQRLASPRRGRPERGGQGPKAATRGRESKPAGVSPAAASDVGLAPAAPSLSPQGQARTRGPGPEGSHPAGERASQQGCRLPRPATSGWPLQRLASPRRGRPERRGQGPKAARDGEQASRGSPCFRQPSMAAGAADVTRARPSAQMPKAPKGPRPSGPSAPAPSAARARGILAKGRRRPENGPSMPAKLRALRPPL